MFGADAFFKKIHVCESWLVEYTDTEPVSKDWMHNVLQTCVYIHI